MRFDLKDLELFVAVAEVGSIARAAEKCHTVASAVSKRLADLEEAFGTALLLRGSKGVALTPAGHALLPRARALLSQATQLDQELGGYSAGVRGQVRIFANISAIVEFLPAALASFLTSHPEIEIQLEEQVSSIVAQAVADNVADLGIVSELPARDDLRLLPFRTDELVLIARPDHPLASRKEIEFSEALGANFVGLHADSSLHYRLLWAAAEAGRTMRLRIQVTSFDAVCAMVSAGLGVGVVPRAATTPYVASLGLAAIPLRDDWAQRQLSVCVRSMESLSPAARLLLDHLIGAA